MICPFYNHGYCELYERVEFREGTCTRVCRKCCLERCFTQEMPIRLCPRLISIRPPSNVKFSNELDKIVIYKEVSNLLNNVGDCNIYGRKVDRIKGGIL